MSRTVTFIKADPGYFNAGRRRVVARGREKAKREESAAVGEGMPLTE
jgi:hypothetical protein